MITLAHAWIGLGRWEKDPRWFQKAAQWQPVYAQSAQDQQRIHAQVEIDLLESLALWELEGAGKENVRTALDRLTCSLCVGIPGGYQRVYLNESQPMYRLLGAWLAQESRLVEASGVDRDAVQRLHDHLHAQEAAQPDRQTGGLVEPLTEREKEVLHLLVLGLSNHAMAEKLVVSEGTIKTHVHNVLGKLGAQSRTHALALAKELKLL